MLSPHQLAEEREIDCRPSKRRVMHTVLSFDKNTVRLNWTCSRSALGLLTITYCLKMAELLNVTVSLVVQRINNDGVTCCITWKIKRWFVVSPSYLVLAPLWRMGQYRTLVYGGCVTLSHPFCYHHCRDTTSGLVEWGFYFSYFSHHLLTPSDSSIEFGVAAE